MKTAIGRIAATLLALGLLATFVRAVLPLPQYGESRGPYERRAAVEAVRVSHAENLDAFVNFDLRGFDTLGEEYVFLVAIAGFSLLLAERRGTIGDRPRDARGERDPREDDPVVRVAAVAFVPIALAYGIYIVIHGQLTPGGGFQGGVTIATAALAVWLGAGYRRFERTFPKTAVESFETIGALGYVALGVAALLASGSFLRNVLPLGKAGDLLSSGSILALNDAVGVAVAGGFIVLFDEFLKETRAEKTE